MAQDEAGHPDELTQALKNWLGEAHSPIGSLPEGTDPVERVVRRFIDYWQNPARGSIESIEECLNKAAELCRSCQDYSAIEEQLGFARYSLQDLRDHLALWDWNKDSSGAGEQ
jgi:hypothetical protein